MTHLAPVPVILGVLGLAGIVAIWVSKYRQLRFAQLRVQGISRAVDSIVQQLRGSVAVRDALSVVADPQLGPGSQDFQRLLDGLDQGMPLGVVSTRFATEVPCPASRHLAAALTSHSSDAGQLEGDLTRFQDENRRRSEVRSMLRKNSRPVRIMAWLSPICGVATAIAIAHFVSSANSRSTLAIAFAFGTVGCVWLISLLAKLDDSEAIAG